MTKEEKKRWIIWNIRKMSYRYPLRSKAFAAARIDRGVYRCANCNMKFGSKDIQVDHVIPVVDPAKGFTDWNDYIERMFCDVDGLQILCRDACHRDKTQAENKSRRERIKARKKKRASKKRRS